MKWEHDPEADWGYICIKHVVLARSELVDNSRVVDYASDGTVIGAEVWECYRDDFLEQHFLRVVHVPSSVSQFSFSLCDSSLDLMLLLVLLPI